jgi:hypothetical protein
MHAQPMKSFVINLLVHAASQGQATVVVVQVVEPKHIGMVYLGK